MKGGDQKLNFPAGFRFHPTDEELVVHYLCRKCSGLQIAVPIIAEIDLYKFDPWELPGMALYGEKEWYFFSSRERKYPNGSRPNRAAGMGYWKATGADKPIGEPRSLGIKKALVFYSGKAPKGVKTNWIMHEYRLANIDRSAGKKSNLRLDDWVLCRIYNKRGSLEKHSRMDDQKALSSPEYEDQKPKIDTFALTAGPPSRLHFDATESGSSSEAQQQSPEFGREKEVQSGPRWNEFENVNTLEFQHPYMGSFQGDDPFGSHAQFNVDHIPFSLFQESYP